MPLDKSNVRRRSIMRTFAAAGTLGLAGCSFQQDSQDGTGSQTKGTQKQAASKPIGGTWVEGTTADASHLVPYLASDQSTQDAIGLLMDWGGVINDDLEIEPMLFESWELSDSNDVLTIKLRENLRYSEPYGKLTAEDYIYQLNTINQNDKDSWHGYPYVNSFFIDGEPIKYEKTGKYTLRAELPEKRPYWLFTDPTKWMKPLPKKLLKPYVKNKDMEGLKKADEIVNATWTGNLGPFNLKKWQRQSKMEYTKNDDYYLAETKEYKNAPYVKKYIRQIFNESSTTLSALKSGDVTHAGLSVFKASQFKQNPNVNVLSSKFGSSIDFIAMNQRENGWKPFRKKAVRQAFAMAIDKNVIIEKVQRGYGTKVHTWSPKWGPFYDQEGVWVPNGPKIKKAKRKINAALPNHSYRNGRLTDSGGNQVELKLVYVTGWKSTRILKDYLAQQYDKLGVKINAQGTSLTNLYGNYAQNSGKNPKWSAGSWNGGPRSNSTSKKSWDLIPSGFDHAAYTPWDVMSMLFPKKGSFNWWGYVPSRNDLMQQVNSAAKASTKKETQKIVSELLSFISKEQPVVFTDCGAVVEGYRKKVAGLEQPKNQYTSNDAARELYFNDR
ncbi:ABC transporter substrate-binding protein [Haladaptatus cibarius]|uniref:ABC transporter substrate-binding protein n=1 Tax=Haladaptatus cibarius TaxID=453847 RepID=UPI000A3F58E9|nr:ABC transporter substrate-binding protein [Haladaptatus cibarius]